MAWWNRGTWTTRLRILFRADERPACYRRVFTGQATERDCEIVLADLGREAWFFHSGEGLSNEGQQFAAGKRHMYGHILGMLGFVPREVNQLRNVQMEKKPDE